MTEQPQVVILTDPELVLPDERIHPGCTIRAMSPFFGGDYMSVAAMVAKRKMAEIALNGNVQDWQRDIVLPVKVVYSVRNDATGERLFVFGDIPDIERLTKSERASGVVDLAALRQLRRRIENALHRGWLFGQWYSRTEPQGEWGCMHKSYLQSPMGDAEFESFRAKGWVTGDEGVQLS